MFRRVVKFPVRTFPQQAMVDLMIRKTIGIRRMRRPVQTCKIAPREWRAAMRYTPHFFIRGNCQSVIEPHFGTSSLFTRSEPHSAFLGKLTGRESQIVFAESFTSHRVPRRILAGLPDEEGTTRPVVRHVRIGRCSIILRRFLLLAEYYTTELFGKCFRINALSI